MVALNSFLSPPLLQQKNQHASLGLSWHGLGRHHGHGQMSWVFSEEGCTSHCPSAFPAVSELQCPYPVRLFHCAPVDPLLPELRACLEPRNLRDRLPPATRAHHPSPAQRASL